jgi:hypothetical protein
MKIKTAVVWLFSDSTTFKIEKNIIFGHNIYRPYCLPSYETTIFFQQYFLLL